MSASLVVPVDLAGRAYDVHVGEGLIARAGERIAPLLKRARAVVVTDATVAKLHLPDLAASLAAAGIEAQTVVLPPGEATKSFAGFEALTRELLRLKVERGDLVIALGGGVIGDLVGFAAGVVRRGVGFVQIPTTLLAQVDSSVGGKTAINAPEGKNLVGLFHQPRLVLADTGALATLPDRERRAGYAEVVKYGLLGDRDFFDWLDANGERVLRGEPEALAHAVAASVRAKAGIVARDETEQGERALLNLGHTFGHALEAATGFSERLLHGEGVAIGMRLAFDLSARLGLCDGQAPRAVEGHLKRMGLPSAIGDVPGPQPSTDELLAHMAQDKKVEGGKLTFILARGIGDAFVAKDVDVEAVRATLDACP